MKLYQNLLAFLLSGLVICTIKVSDFKAERIIEPRTKFFDFIGIRSPLAHFNFQLAVLDISVVNDFEFWAFAEIFDFSEESFGVSFLFFV